MFPIGDDESSLVSRVLVYCHLPVPLGRVECSDERDSCWSIYELVDSRNWELEPLSVRISSGNSTLEKSSTRALATSGLVILRENASRNWAP